MQSDKRMELYVQWFMITKTHFTTPFSLHAWIMSQIPLFERKEEPEKRKEKPLPANIGAWQRVGLSPTH